MASIDGILALAMCIVAAVVVVAYLVFSDLISSRKAGKEKTNKAKLVKNNALGDKVAVKKYKDAEDFRKKQMLLASSCPFTM